MTRNIFVKFLFNVICLSAFVVSKGEDDYAELTKTIGLFFYSP